MSAGAALLGGCATEEDLASPDEVSESAQAINDGPPGGCDPSDEGCTPDTGGGTAKPQIPPGFFAKSRTTTSITLGWESPTGESSYKLETSSPTGYVLVHSFAPTTGTQSFTVSGLTHDTMHCYRLTARNTAGATAVTELHCAKTDAVNRGPGINRLQLKVEVADVANAGTHDSLGVSLSGTDIGWNFTGLNYGRDNFARNSVFTYDLMLTGITNLRDIAEIAFHKIGSDSLCVRSFSLLANGVIISSKTFGNTSTTCKWVNDATGFSPYFGTTTAELRLTPSFVNFTGGSPSLTIPKAELVSRIEGIVGNMLWVHSGDVNWGDINNNAAVEVFAVANQPDRVHVDLDLEGFPNNAPNPSIDVDFDLVMHFVPNDTGFDLAFDTENFTVDAEFSWWADVLAAFGAPVCAITNNNDCISIVEENIESAVEKGFTKLSQRIALGQLPCTPKLTVNSTADVIFGCQF
jgi:hypothetical protein